MTRGENSVRRAPGLWTSRRGKIAFAWFLLILSLLFDPRSIKLGNDGAISGPLCVCVLAFMQHNKTPMIKTYLTLAKHLLSSYLLLYHHSSVKAGKKVRVLCMLYPASTAVIHNNSNCCTQWTAVNNNWNAVMWTFTGGCPWTPTARCPAFPTFFWDGGSSILIMYWSSCGQELEQNR